MAQPIAPDYGQQFLFPPALEDWVPADHPARFLREFVDQLDLPALGFAMPSGHEGRPPYAPSLLLKIWLYGYFHMEKLLAALDTALDQTELVLAQENNQPPGYRLPAGLAERQALREQVKTGLAQLAADGRNHYHPLEPEARRMKVGGLNRFACNAQAVVDSKEGVIVACEASRQETDAGQLVPMIEQARETLGVASPETTTLADTGYGAGADLQAAQEKQLPVLAPPAEGKPAHDNPQASQHFRYEPLTGTVTCPQGRPLDHEGHTTKNHQRVQRYRCHCRDCPVRGQCTRDPKGRQIELWPHQEAGQAMRAQLQETAGQVLYRQRSQLIERRFGQVKQHDGFRRWTVWGLEAVRTQWSLLCATLNLRIFYKRWRQNRPVAPLSPAMMTTSEAKLGNCGWTFLNQVRQMHQTAGPAINPILRLIC